MKLTNFVSPDQTTLTLESPWHHLSVSTHFHNIDVGYLHLPYSERKSLYCDSNGFLTFLIINVHIELAVKIWDCQLVQQKEKAANWPELVKTGWDGTQRDSIWAWQVSPIPPASRRTLLKFTLMSRASQTDTHAHIRAGMGARTWDFHGVVFVWLGDRKGKLSQALSAEYCHRGFQFMTGVWQGTFLEKNACVKYANEFCCRNIHIPA